jgi:hypothetical protein
MSNHALVSSEAVEMEAVETDITAIIEKQINTFLIEVGLKPNQRELIRAFIAVSKGSPYFEVSYKDLGAIVYGGNLENKAECKRASDKIRNNIKTLLKWQGANRLEIIQIVTVGNRVKTDDGQFNYNKTRFYFSLLDEILKSISFDSTETLEISVEAVIEKLKEKYQPVERRKSYHPNHKIQKAGKTLLTTMDNIFKLNIEAKSNPVESCQRFLRELNKRFEELSSDWLDQQSGEKVIADFERLMNSCNENGELSSNHNKESELSLKS